jgi:NAD-dependent dihydropyrimidine dehydrogenase PreA subunit
MPMFIDYSKCDSVACSVPGTTVTPCIDICPVPCISLNEGYNPPRPVIDHDMCLECQACAGACPYGAIVLRRQV